MTAQVLDGKALAGQIRAELTQRVAALAARGTVPGLGTVLVGDDPGSRAYVNGKHRDCAQVGIASIRRDLPEDATQAQVEAVVDELNADPACTGYIVQLPLPAGLDAHAVLNRMDPAKDADGLHPANLGKLVLGEPGPLPCTPRGIVELLRRYGVAVAGADVTVIGRGITVGRALGLLLTRRTENATVTLCHTGTKDLAAHTRTADIVVVAAGGPGLLTADMVKPGAAVVDVGITRTDARPGRRRRPRGRRGGRLAGPDAGRRRPDDPRHAPGQRRRSRRVRQPLARLRPPEHVHGPAGLAPQPGVQAAAGVDDHPAGDDAGQRGGVDGPVVGPLGQVQDQVGALGRLEDRRRVAQPRPFPGRAGHGHRVVHRHDRPLGRPGGRRRPGWGSPARRRCPA